MKIPLFWRRVSSTTKDARGVDCKLVLWGGGASEEEALAEGEQRMRRLSAVLASGKRLEHWYEYATRPVREEVVQTFDDLNGDPGEQVAVVTRNGYGALILNTARMLFLDIDFEQGLVGSLRSLFGKSSAETQRLEQLQHVLSGQGGMSFRIYRTAGGFRVLGIGRDFDPTGREAEDLMAATGTDQQFRKLCKVQKCFRARLTPKPWRCGVPRPWMRYPYRSEKEAQEFRDWLVGYEREADRYATCRFLFTVGSAEPVGDQLVLLELHDEITRANRSMTLA